MSLPTSPSEDSLSTKTGVVYRIYNRMNSKSYVGQTTQPRRRIRDHFNLKKGCLFLHRAIKKYGRDAFVVEILESDVPEVLLSKLEILHIRFFDCKVPNGYNLTDGGDGSKGISHSLESRKRISEAKKGKKLSLDHRRKLSKAQKGDKNGFFGKTHTPETRRKLSEARKGKRGVPHSVESRQKISEAKKGKTRSAATRKKISETLTGRKGAPHTPESRRKISDAKKGRTHSSETRRKISQNHADVSGENNPNFGKKHSPETLRKIRRPEYESVHEYYFSLPVNMPIKEKNKRARKAFSNVPDKTMYKWFRRWESEQAKEQTSPSS